MENSKRTKDQWNADLYDEKHSFVSKFGSDLLDILLPKKDEYILDLGCGTGDLTDKIAGFGANVLGMDNAESMVHQAKSKYPDIPFIVNDVRNMKYHHEFDAVFSNAALHWIKPPKQALANMYQSLKEGGRLVAEFGGKGNVKSITDEIIKQLKSVGINFETEQFPWYFPTIGEYAALMEEIGFRVTFAHHFDRPTPLDGEKGLRNWIEMFAIHMLEGISENTKELIVANAENNLKSLLYHNGRWIADYKRIRIVGIKE